MSTQWPIKILLAHPKAPFFKNARLTVAADCTILSNQLFIDRFRSGEPVVIGCPLLEDPDRLAEKLALILGESEAESDEVYTMEVPCCHAIHLMSINGLRESGKLGAETSHFIVRVGSGLIEQYKPGMLDESMLQAERKAHEQA